MLERKIYQLSDFVMDLYTQAVTGISKTIITGAFQSMINTGQISDVMELLKIMDDIFHDRNSDQNASSLLHAYKQFMDKALYSFLPHFQLPLSRSTLSISEDVHKIYELQKTFN